MSMTFTFDGADGCNFSNSNAWRILGALNIEQDYSGEIAVNDLRGRILTCLAVGPKATLDVADPSSRALVAELSSGGATMVDCSPELADLLEGRLPLLLALCDEADEAGATEIWWG